MPGRNIGLYKVQVGRKRLPRNYSYAKAWQVARKEFDKQHVVDNPRPKRIFVVEDKRAMAASSRRYSR